MRRLLLPAAVVAAAYIAAACAPTPANAQVIDWIAVAANNHGWGYGEGSTEELARSEAIERCEQRTGRSCSGMTSSVPAEWPLVVVRCPNGRLATGGSRIDYPTAVYVASTKVGYQRCATLVEK